MSDRALKALESAIELAGGQSALARLVGVSQPAVWNWLNNTHRTPAEYVLPIERATGVPRTELRPDLYPTEDYRPSANNGASKDAAA